MRLDKTIFMILGLVALVGMFILDWKMALCIFGFLWADRYLDDNRGEIIFTPWEGEDNE